jgi:hypothetical protein
MWTNTFCPNFAFKSFTFVNIGVQVMVFFLSVIYSGTDDLGLNEKMFLGNNVYTLDRFGMRMPWKIVT